jgi:hypothetical protein
LAGITSWPIARNVICPRRATNRTLPALHPSFAQQTALVSRQHRRDDTWKAARLSQQSCDALHRRSAVGDAPSGLAFHLEPSQIKGRHPLGHVVHGVLRGHHA